jgi:hypothetical protein
VAGQTLLAIDSATAVEGGTGAVTLGEELVVDSSQVAALRGGKGLVAARRVAGRAHGEILMISEPMVAIITLPPEKMKLSFLGAEIKDSDSLWELGCRTDDLVALEFESPASPELLKFMRTPTQEKSGKDKKK